LLCHEDATSTKKKKFNIQYLIILSALLSVFTPSKYFSVVLCFSDKSLEKKAAADKRGLTRIQALNQDFFLCLSVKSVAKILFP